MAGPFAIRRMRHGAARLNIKMCSPEPNIFRGFPLLIQNESAFGADHTAGCSQRWPWRATLMYLPRVWISTASMIGQSFCEVGKAARNGAGLQGGSQAGLRFLAGCQRLAVEITGAPDPRRRRS